MKVSLSWLQDYVTVNMPVDRLADLLTMVGLEVETIYDRYEYLNSVRVGSIKTIEPHPQADKLRLCRVETGGREYQVICGAPNAAVDQKAPLALPGTVFTDGSVLKKSTIRGQKSEGMLCSEAELGLGVEYSGIMVLNENLKTGTPLRQALNLNDPVLEIGLTPNRSDCLSILGVAREIAAFNKTKIKRPQIQLPPSQHDINDFTTVTIEAPDHCPRYAARLVQDITVGPSPFWLQNRLLSVGLRPINNIVDITNYILMETGQPLHAFDFDHLADNRIVVRTARSGERFTTLDEKEYTLSDDTLMICDGQKPVAIGGVMGGLNSEIKAGTTRVLIESAYFDPISIRKTAKRLGLNTEASHRFERSVDPMGTLYALDRAAQLMTELGNGRLIGGTIDIHYGPAVPPPVHLSVTATNRTLGLNLDQSTICALLQEIEFGVTAENDDLLIVTIPSFRVDVSRPEDLMEEVARRYGYDEIPPSFPTIPANLKPEAKLLGQRHQIRTLLTGMGFSEAIHYSFIHKSSCDQLQLPQNDQRRQVIEILNPLTEDQAIMRTTLIPGLLETVQRNIARQNRTLKLFETGRVFISQNAETQPEEIEMLAGLWTGERFEPGWHTKTIACDFYDIKGAVQGLLEAVNIASAKFTQLPDDECAYTLAGSTAQICINKNRIGIIGQVDPQVLNAYDIKQDIFIFEIDLHQLIHYIPGVVLATALPKYPSTSRDATLIVDKTIEAETIVERIRQMQQDWVEDVRLFDVFEGKSLPRNHRSISLRIIYRSKKKTLEDKAVNQLHHQITDALVSEFKADLPAEQQSENKISS